MIDLPWGGQWFAGYPLVPWIGVMALGYVVGVILAREPAKRRQRLVLLGMGMLAVFIVLRSINLYGDPLPWSKGPAPALESGAGPTLAGGVSRPCELRS